MELGNEKAKQTSLVVTSTILTVLGTFVVVARVITRHFVVRNIGKDDWFMVAAWLLTVGYLIMIGIMSKFGVGLRSSEITLDQTVHLMKITLGIEVVYYAEVFCIKTSILFFYLRIAAERAFRLLCYITIGILSVFVGICIIVCLAQCRPINKLWDFIGAVDGSCAVNTTAFFYSTSAFNIITDIWILVLPVQTLRSIQRTRNEKIALFVIFGVGIFACIASIVRLHTIYLFTLSTDPFHDGIQVNLWSMIEVNTAILCASIPALKPILSPKQFQRTISRRGTSGHSRGRPSQEFGKSSQGTSSSSRSGKPKKGNHSILFDSLSTTVSQSAEGQDKHSKYRKKSFEHLNHNSSSEEHILYPIQGLRFEEPEIPTQTLDRNQLPIQGLPGRGYPQGS